MQDHISTGSKTKRLITNTSEELVSQTTGFMIRPMLTHIMEDSYKPIKMSSEFLEMCHSNHSTKIFIMLSLLQVTLPNLQVMKLIS